MFDGGHVRFIFPTRHQSDRARIKTNRRCVVNRKAWNTTYIRSLDNSQQVGSPYKHKKHVAVAGVATEGGLQHVAVAEVATEGRMP